MTHKHIDLRYITRVEGEGALSILLDGEQVIDARLKIFEPPRFFEALLCGRSVWEAPDITARVCGICPVAYQMSAVHAFEHLAGLSVDGPLASWRRLFYCGEWIQSHSLHLFMLHLPDFLGYPSLVAMAKDHSHLVKSGLFIKQIGSDIVNLLGGRDIHPINVCVGGFYKLPTVDKLKTLMPRIRQAYDSMLNVAQMLMGLEYPEADRDYEFLALRGDGEYPMCRGRIVSSRGLNIDMQDFEDHIEEFQVRESTALYSRRKEGGAYLCGPMARLTLNFDLLPREIQDLGNRLGVGYGTRNPYRSILVRAVEITFCLHESMRIIESGFYPKESRLFLEVPRGSARWATEAPRGLLYHRYEVDDKATIHAASLIPPTSQNQLSIEADLKTMITPYLLAEQSVLQHFCERIVRNHDPCISCAAHFLRVERHDLNRAHKRPCQL